jgi:protein SCO1/2
MKRYRSLYLLLAISLICGLLVGLVAAQNNVAPTLRINGVWVRPSAGNLSAAYMWIINDGAAPERLIAVESGVAVTALYETRFQDAVARTRLITEVSIPAGETVRLQPGGAHILLADVAQPLAVGDSLPLTLVFASGTRITVEAWVSETPIPNERIADDLTTAALAAADQGHYVGQVVNPPIQTQDFSAPGSVPTLTRLSDTAGTWRVIFFGYMHCPDFCPLTLVEYRKVKALLGTAARDVQFMFISVDSVRDTPEALQQYLEKFDPEFIGFSPDDATLSRIQPDYGFYYLRRLASDNLAVYTVDHSTRSYLIDRTGVVRASFAYDTAPQLIADALLWYLAHE